MQDFEALSGVLLQMRHPQQGANIRGGKGGKGVGVYSTMTKWTHSIVGGDGEVEGRLVLVLGLVKYDDGHRG